MTTPNPPGDAMNTIGDAMRKYNAPTNTGATRLCQIGSPTTPDEHTVRGEVLTLASTISEIAGLTAHIETRLEVALRSPGPEDAVEAGGIHHAAPLAITVRSMRYDLDVSVQRLRSILERLEL